MRNDITFCVPVYNNAGTITMVLKRLIKQSVFPKIAIVDCGSNDGSYELLLAQAEYKYYGDADIIVTQQKWIKKLPKDEGRMHVREELVKLVKTPYLFFVDGDILIPYHCVPEMVESLIKNPECGYIAIRYSIYTLRTKHVQLGASLWNTEDAKAVKFAMWKGGCTCSNVQKCLQIRNKKWGYVKEYVAMKIGDLIHG